MSDVDRCIICGEIIPEGRQVCPSCEAKIDRLRPVIRCKDCARCRKTNRYWGLYCETWSEYVTPNDYCSRGRR